MSNEPSRPYLEQALTHCAACFASMSQGAQEEAESRLAKIRDIDMKAKSRLKEDEYENYLKRRRHLTGLFGRRIVEELKGQVQQEILANAQALIQAFEKWDE